MKIIIAGGRNFITQFPADWNKQGKAARYKRNEQMANYANALIAFWDGKSKGTKHMIKLAKSRGLKTNVYYLKINCKIF